MIARIWHGRTHPGDADAYENLLRSDVLPGIARREVPGYRGAHLMRRTLDDEVEFVTVLWFDSLDDVKAFAGEDHERAYVPERARLLLSSFDARSRHYEIVLTPEETI